ncbi:metal-dependent hydrolase [Limnobacter humi]|uniref:Metal-dependent hydrolase n=1 Tax=Limnobacter humi TaxID=1778671 RepID=A0ABT1WD26_9BURK|nr:metal-dependent hydrolase [Limnobacter humi]MCQ8895428.1 metal-dependent hydrolase [Limnobacter humi]
MKNIIPVRRDVKVNLPEDKVTDWHEKGRHVTHFMNALSIFFPAGERMFMDAVRAYRDDITDPELKKAVVAFIGQEAMHSREHVEYNEILDRAGLPASKLDSFLWSFLAFIKKRLGRKLTLAGTIALEHYTALMADQLLRNPEVLGTKSEQAYKDMWTWHALEETEHKAVAYDVWNHVIPNTVFNRFLRRFAMVLATAIFWPLVGYFHTRLVFADKATKGTHLKGFWTVTTMLWGKRIGVLRNPVTSGEFTDYFKADFHPWMHDNSQFLERIDGFVKQVEGSGRAPNEELQQAIRSRMNSQLKASAA